MDKISRKKFKRRDDLSSNYNCSKFERYSFEENKLKGKMIDFIDMK